MSDLIDQMFLTDNNLEKTGVVFTYAPGVFIKLARAGGSNAKFSKVWENKCRPYRAQIERKLLPDATMRQLMAEAFAEAVVLDWGGISVDGVENAPCTVENVVKKFMSNPGFQDDVTSKATEISNFQNESLDTDLKN